MRITSAMRTRSDDPMRCYSSDSLTTARVRAVDERTQQTIYSSSRPELVKFHLTDGMVGIIYTQIDQVDSDSPDRQSSTQVNPDWFVSCVNLDSVRPKTEQILHHRRHVRVPQLQIYINNANLELY